MNSGYSKTPLAKKLGIKDGHQIHLVNSPKYYWKLFEVLPENVIVVENPKPESIDFIHLFCKTSKDLTANAKTCKTFLKKDGIFWVSWPKGTSKIETDLKREQVRGFLLKINLVDVKVAAIDEDWSGLKFMYRIKDR